MDRKQRDIWIIFRAFTNLKIVLTANFPKAIESATYKLRLALYRQFFDRAKEYILQDYNYRHGDFAPYTTLHGPFMRLKVRPYVNIVGDHHIFAFTFPPNDYGQLASVLVGFVAHCLSFSTLGIFIHASDRFA